MNTLAEWLVQPHRDDLFLQTFSMTDVHDARELLQWPLRLREGPEEAEVIATHYWRVEAVS